MNRLLIAAALALAASAAHAQQGPAPTAPPTSQQEAEAAAATGGQHSTTVYHGPHRYPLKERGHRAGDPPIIDHSADTLIVEPTHSTITIQPPTTP